MDYSGEIVAHSARLAEFKHRDDSHDLGSLVRRRPKRGTAARARRLATAGMAVAALIVATILFGLVVAPIGLNGLFLVVVLMFGVLLAISAWPSGSGSSSRPVAPYKADMPNKAVIDRLAHLLHRSTRSLPPVAVSRVDAIGAQLPMLESQLVGMDPLNPLAQDARRLMGEHLPELIERYERVPAQYRRERDGEGMSVDERLVAGLDAARSALDDLGRRLAQDERDAFETQGRFIESRYRDDGPGPGA